MALASQLSLAELIGVGCELCGFYAPSDEDEGFTVREPLTTPVRLGRAVRAARGMHGVKLARRALSYVMPRSRSPMETAQALLLCLPRSLGGQGFAHARLNERVPLAKAARSQLGRDHVECDLYWPRMRVAVEYDSDRYHTGPERIARDARRRNALAEGGVTVFTMTRDQLFDPAAFRRCARMIATCLKRRGPSYDIESLRREDDLRRAVLGSGGVLRCRHPGKLG
ncbi:hypothetical protein B5F40_08535 [Gordonibacter sp. An230]|nr:hypothetical protein B5F40_08535 [Gordonibacter sp. An230]